MQSITIWTFLVLGFPQILLFFPKKKSHPRVVPLRLRASPKRQVFPQPIGNGSPTATHPERLRTGMNGTMFVNRSKGFLLRDHQKVHNKKSNNKSDLMFSKFKRWKIHHFFRPPIKIPVWQAPNDSLNSLHLSISNGRTCNSQRWRVLWVSKTFTLPLDDEGNEVSFQNRKKPIEKPNSSWRASFLASCFVAELTQGFSWYKT